MTADQGRVRSARGRTGATTTRRALVTAALTAGLTVPWGGLFGASRPERPVARNGRAGSPADPAPSGPDLAGPDPSVAATPAATASGTSPSGQTPLLFRARFPGGDGLVTNEYAYRHPDAADARVDPDWSVTSGSLFARWTFGWTGAPDGAAPGPTSVPHTGSAVFRLVTRRRDFGDTTVSLRALVEPPVATTRTPAVDWDGGHLWLRYHSAQELYAVSFRRRDGLVVVKRKLPPPDSAPGAAGVYTTLATAHHPVAYGSWHRVSASATNTAPGSVRLRLTLDGSTVLDVEDHSPGTLVAAGGVGLRADNSAVVFSHFDARPVREAAPLPAADATPTPTPTGVAVTTNSPAAVAS
ncbi:hypothetical protein ACIQU5_07720 [Streptomyces sp. NPDC090306]|uniref:hypothetical protein n=1 Tax=Streptomyces sp. NPDC090306 TaxID=3365961 RepID=UPI0037FA48C4